MRLALLALAWLLAGALGLYGASHGPTVGFQFIAGAFGALAFALGSYLVRIAWKTK